VTDSERTQQYQLVKPLRLLADLRPHVADGVEFETLYREEWPHVWLWLLRLGVSEGDLPDLTQEVFVRALRHWASCDRTRPMRPWLFGIAYRVRLGFGRSRRHHLELVEAHGLAHDPGPTGDEIVALGERRRMFLKVMDSMELNRRAVFVLHEIEGRSAPEIAEIVDAPLNTVYSRLRLARRDFEAAVRRQHTPWGRR
jgi:RNA polymerase sigma-70 factor, ECF subfamily